MLIYNILSSKLLRIDDFIVGPGFKFFSILEINLHTVIIFCKALEVIKFIIGLAKKFFLKDLDNIL